MSTISCGNEDYFIETSELQLNAMPFAEANIDTTKFEIESWVYANTLNGYRYNYDSANGGDPDCISYPSVLLLKNDDFVRSKPFYMTYGRHHI